MAGLGDGEVGRVPGVIVDSRVSEDEVENDQAVSVDDDGTVNNGEGIKPFPTGASADRAAAGRNRKTLGRWKLGELGDDCKLGHDKFEGMTVQDSHYYERRRFPGGGNRARGRNRGEGRGSPKNHNNNNNYNNSSQTSGPKSVRGRGPIRYHQPSTQNASYALEQSRRPAKPMEKTSHASSGRASTATAASESAQVGSRKNVVSNSVSTPFYPSGSSSKETNLSQKKNAQSNWGQRPSVMSQHHPVSKSNVAATRADARAPISVRQMSYQPVPPRNGNYSGSRASFLPKTSSLTHGVESIDLTESNDSKTALAGKGNSEMTRLPGADGPDIAVDGACACNACPSGQPAALTISFEELLTEISLAIENGVKEGKPAPVLRFWEAFKKEMIRTPHLFKPIHELTDEDINRAKIRVRDEPSCEEFDDPYEDDVSHPDSRWK